MRDFEIKPLTMDELEKLSKIFGIDIMKAHDFCDIFEIPRQIHITPEELRRFKGVS